MKAQKTLIFLGIIGILFLFFFFPNTTFAAIYINEFSSDTAGTAADPDWVEIYNSGPSDVDLAIYRLRDDTQSNKKDLSGTINSGGFISFDFSNNLNKTGDTIKLVLITDENSSLDQVTYGSGSIPVPSGGQTVGRQSDGGSSWVLFAQASKGSTNNTATPVPTATQTPTPTLTPTNIPTPTKTPTPTPTPKQPTVTPSPTSKPSATIQPTATGPIKPSITSTNTIKKSTEKVASKTAVLGTTISPTPKILVQAATSDNSIATLFILIGLVFFAGCGILGLRIYQKNKFSQDE